MEVKEILDIRRNLCSVAQVLLISNTAHEPLQTAAS